METADNSVSAPEGIIVRPLRSFPRVGQTWILVLLLALPGPCLADTLRVMTYNLLNYPGASGSAREVHFRSVLNQVQPDLLVTQEVQGLSAANQFLDNVLNVVNPGAWSLATFTYSPDSERACFYRTSQLDLQGSVVLPTDLRDINGWFFRPDGTTGESDFRIYSLHLKASQGASNENQRLAEVTVLRNHLNALPSDTHFMVLGDYNIYTSSEPAWSKLTGSEADNDGQLFDPINRVGNWHDNSSFADVHTQSPRTTDLGDGGATGGMDDRFDFGLMNDDMLDQVGLDYVVASYVAYGQDGNHFNQAINSGTNTAVPDSIADALYAASDHLPVFFDIELSVTTNPPVMAVSGDLDFGDAILDAFLQRPVVVANQATAPASDLDYITSAGTGFSIPAAPGPVAAGDSDTLLVTFDTSVLGSRVADVIISGDDPSNPADTLVATGRTISHAQPSVSSTELVTSTALYLGSLSQGAFTDSILAIYNYFYSSTQAQLEVHDFEISGADSAYFSLVGFSPQLIGATAGSVTLHFDDASVSQARTYSATLVVHTRDDQTLPGAADRSDLTWSIFAIVTDLSTDTAPVVTQTRLAANVPNPFNPTTTILFDLAASTRVRLSVFDARGRWICNLVDEPLPAGTHRVVWDGRNEQGRLVSSGVYFARLRTLDFEQAHRMTLVR
jgi:endonuclease/exonuclease/phosphatase family metal-dependent hydrolase